MPRRPDEPLLDMVLNDVLFFDDGTQVQIPLGVSWRKDRRDKKRPLVLFSLTSGDEDDGWRTSLGEPKCLIEAMVADLCRV